MGEYVITPDFKFASPFSEALAAVSVDGELFGFVDAIGDEIIPFMFDYASEFHHGLARVSVEDGRSWFIDRSGVRVFGPFQWMSDFF
jgi:hypothetical protein